MTNHYLGSSGRHGLGILETMLVPAIDIDLKSALPAKACGSEEYVNSSISYFFC